MSGKQLSNYNLEDIIISGRILRCGVFHYKQSKSMRIYLRPFQNPEIKICLPSRPLSLFFRYSKNDINKFLTDKSTWIKKHVENWTSLRIPLKEGYIPCLGNNFKILSFNTNRTNLPQRTKVISNTASDIIHYYGGEAEAGPYLKEWLTKQLLARVKLLLPNYLEKIGWRNPLPDLGINNATRTWGSCHAKSHKIKLNWRLALASHEVVSYVLAHEVAHLKHPNHGSQFWSLTKDLYPETNLIRMWLKQNVHELHSWDFS